MKIIFLYVLVVGILVFLSLAVYLWIKSGNKKQQ